MTYSCTGECNTCSVDHSQDNITTNRGHGISYSPKVREYVFKTDFLNRDGSRSFHCERASQKDGRGYMGYQRKGRRQ